MTDQLREALRNARYANGQTHGAHTEALTTYAQIGDWLSGGIKLEQAREVARNLAAEYARLTAKP